MGILEINKNIFQDTEDFVNNSEQLLAAVSRTRHNQKLITADLTIADYDIDLGKDAEIVVSGKRSLEAARAYKGKKICILNFASATNPGGGVIRGSSAQEESICRCSTLYFCLNTPENMSGFYLPHRRANNPLYNDDLIYSPDVIVIKTDTLEPIRMDKTDWYSVNVITCAAPNLCDLPDNFLNSDSKRVSVMIDNIDLHDILKTRIRRIFQIAAAERNEVLILGAFGCGAFCNPPEVVAEVFRLVTQEYLRYFYTIEYAIFHRAWETKNYRIFQETLSEI